MAYENTEVPVSRSQEVIRKLVMQHGGFGFAAVSEHDPTGEMPASEGFHAKVLIDGKPYAVRVMAKVKRAPKGWTTKQQADFAEKEQRRIWRVLYYHLKSVFEAADSGVMEFRELMLPYIMVGERSIAEHILPKLDAAIANPQRMLSAAGEDA